MDLEKLEQIDKVKSKILRYIVYKKRTETEIRNKFNNMFDDNIFESVIEELKNLGYINDKNYIQRAVDEYIALNNMSMKEIKYKLLSKGIKSELIEDYFYENKEKLTEYEIQSAKNIFIKKGMQTDKQEIINYLRKKGYIGENIKNAEHFYDGNN